MLALPYMNDIPDKTQSKLPYCFDQHSTFGSEVKMETYFQLQRDADAIASLDVLSRLNRLTEERLRKQQLMEMEMMRRQEERLLEESQRSYALSQLSPNIQQVGVDDFESMLEVGGVKRIEKQGKQKTPGQRATISVQKVEAALRSEPQRGKKRTNLTEEERNELTRTRNREHARNTRMRKKAREMELEQNQKTLQSFLASKKVDSERIECLKHFIAARQNMMNTSAVAFQLDDRSKDIVDQRFSDLVVDGQHSFEFGTSGLDCLVPCDKKMSPITKMRYLDQEMRKKIFESNEISFSTFFAYEVQCGVDGIAMSKNGSCFAQLDLVLLDEPMMNVNEIKSHKTVLFKILLKAQFGKGENASKLTSMQWIILEDCCVLNNKKAIAF